MRTIDEKYTVACNAGSLKIDQNDEKSIDVLIASGWTPGLLGGVLMRLHSESI